MELRTYSLSGGYKGKDDLLSEYAFHGNSQGDTSCSNNVEEYKASGGWMGFRFDGVTLEQEAIDKEVLRRKEANKVYIEKCKEDGTYGDYLGDITIEMHPCPYFDEPKSEPSLSFSFQILDLSK